MRVGEFEVDDAFQRLRKPFVISTLRPWVDAGGVGTLVLNALQEALDVDAVAALARPGDFFDFTRYRPMVKYNGDERMFTLPNTTVSFARGPNDADLALIDVLEPHARAEDYIDAVVELLTFVGAKTFCRVGASHGATPHTREPRVSHSRGGNRFDPRTGRELPRMGRYEGPTSIMNLLTDRLAAQGIECTTLMLQVPHYARLEENYSAAASMLEALGTTAGLAAELSEWTASYRERGEQQRQEIDRMVGADPALGAALKQLEDAYDAQYASDDDVQSLPPEIERFLSEVLGTIDRDEDPESS